MAKIFAAASIHLVFGCDCDAQLSFTDNNCLSLQQQGYDCSGCSVCVQAYDSVSYQSDAWTQSMNNIRSLFQAGSVTWDQDIASDIYAYLQANEYKSMDTQYYQFWDVDHSCNKYPDDPDYCSYSRPSPYGPSGENIAASSLQPDGTTPCNFVPDIALGWASENLNCVNAACTSTTGDVGHFTAMVWKGAQTFGCASTKEGVTMCRFKGDDTKDCSTPNMGDCYDDNVHCGQYINFQPWCPSSTLNVTSLV
jgi:hypothetical protein